MLRLSNNNSKEYSKNYFSLFFSENKLFNSTRIDDFFFNFRFPWCLFEKNRQSFIIPDEWAAWSIFIKSWCSTYMRQSWVIVRKFLMQMYLHSFLFYLNENWHNSCNSQQKQNSWWSRSIFSNFPKMSVTVSSYREIDDSKCNLYHKTDQGTVINSRFFIPFWNFKVNVWSLIFI